MAKNALWQAMMFYFHSVIIVMAIKNIFFWQSKSKKRKKAFSRWPPTLKLLQNNLKPLHTIYGKLLTCDFKQCGILTSVDSDKPVQPPFKLLETPNAVRPVA